MIWISFRCQSGGRQLTFKRSDQGKPVIGGSSALWYGIGIEGQVARDFSLPWVAYGPIESKQPLVETKVGPNLSEDLSQDGILEIAQMLENWKPGAVHAATDNEIAVLRRYI